MDSAVTRPTAPIATPRPDINPALKIGFVPELDGLRGIAILVVMLHRFWPEQGALAKYGRWAELGWVGVDLFFVISGFLICGILVDSRERPHYFRNFYARRALRIFPLYYLFIVVCFLVFPLLQGGPYFESAFVRNAGSPLWYLFYLGNVPEASGHNPPFLIAPVWSLAIEEQFYITFPFIVAALDRKRLKALLIGLLVFAPTFRAATLLLFSANERIQYLATPSRVDVIAAGCLVALLFRSATKISPTRASWAAALAALVFVATVGLSGLDRTRPFGRTLGYSVVALTFAVAVAWVLVQRNRRATFLLRMPVLTFVGKRCYGLYLLHRPASLLVDQLVQRFDLALPAESALLICVKLTMALALASISWATFEQPLLRLKSRFE